MNICFYARASQCELYGKIGLLIESTHNVCYVTQNDSEALKLKKLGCKGKIFSLTKFIQSNWNNNTLLEQYNNLRQIEKRYTIESLWGLFYTDRFLINYNYNDSLKFIKLHIAFFEKLIREEKCHYHINESIALFSSYIFYYIGKYTGCKYIGIGASKYKAKENFYFMNSPFNYNPLLIKYYEERSFTYTELAKAQDVINEYKKNKYRADFNILSNKAPKFQFIYFYHIIKYLYYLAFVSISKYDYEKYITTKKNKIVSLSNYIKYRVIFTKYYKKPELNDQYYLFTLHYQPEANTLIASPNYEKQLNAIDLIAKRIPADSILYVKEHFAQLGHREISFFYKLKKYPNVKLIAPFVDTHDLIANCRGIIVLTGTAGWEALFYKKPVYMLGKFWFDCFKFINNIDNINDLTKIIDVTENKIISDDEYYNELILFIASFLKSLQTGSYLIGKPNRDLVLSQNNILKIKNSLLEFIAKHNTII